MEEGAQTWGGGGGGAGGTYEFSYENDTSHYIMSYFESTLIQNKQKFFLSAAS